MQYYKNLWIEVDVNMDRTLDLSEIKQLLKKMNYEVRDDYLKSIFNLFDEDHSGKIEFDEFINLMNSMRERRELEVIFNTYKNKETNLI